MPDTDPLRFKMDACDGQCAAQVHILNADDLEYWQAEAKRTKHKAVYSYTVPAEYYMNTYGVAYDVYQIVPIILEVQHA